MSRDVDTVRSFLAAFNRRDFGAAAGHVHPDVELRPALQGLDVDSHYRGRDDLMRFMEVITDAWESYVVEPVETIEAPGDRILVRETWHARGRDGIEFDFELIDVYTLRDGLVSRIDGFRDKTEALTAVGLPEAGT